MMQHSFKLGKFQLHHRKGKNPLAESEAVVLVAEAEESYCTFTDSSNMRLTDLIHGTTATGELEN